MSQYNDRFRTYRKNMSRVIGSKAAAAQYDTLQEAEVGHLLLHVLDDPKNIINHIKRQVLMSRSVSVAKQTPLTLYPSGRLALLSSKLLTAITRNLSRVTISSTWLENQWTNSPALPFPELS